MSAAVTARPPTAPVTATGSSGSADAPVIPNERVLVHAATLAMKEDKPILLDYYADTKPGGPAFLGEDKDTKERILVKNHEEYTSPVKKLFKVKDDIIVITENSIYIVSGGIATKKISSAGM